MVRKSSVPLSQAYRGGTLGQFAVVPGQCWDSEWDMSLKALADMVLERLSPGQGRDSERDTPGTTVPRQESSWDRRVSTVPRREFATVDYGPLPVCCECGQPIHEELATLWGGELCHRACGEAAFEREKASRRAMGGTA